MPITSKQAAFDQLETQRYGIPFEAIDYLYNHPRDEEILAKITYHLTHAHNEEIFYDEVEDYYANSPLWYAIVAENYLEMALVEPLIQMYLTEIDHWDFLNEQGVFLLEKLCKKLGDEAVELILQTLEKHQREEVGAISYLFGGIAYASEEKFGKRILKLLEDPNYYGVSMAAMYMLSAKFRFMLPRFKDLLTYYKQIDLEDDYQINENIIEIEGAIREIETDGGSNFTAFAESRAHWKVHYKTYNEHFDPPKEEKPLPTPKAKTRKVGRNEPCPCGSGKKYKKCCLNKK